MLEARQAIEVGRGGLRSRSHATPFTGMVPDYEPLPPSLAITKDRTITVYGIIFEYFEVSVCH